MSQFGPGINLGNTLEEPLEGRGPGGFWKPSYFDAYKSIGFRTVRVPVRWDNHTMSQPPYTVDAAWLTRVDTVVSYGLQIGLNVIINSHHDFWVDTADPEAFDQALPRFKAIWAQVSAHFAAKPPALLFEVFNEPHHMKVDQLNQLNALVLPVIRSTNPTRGVVLGGAGWMSIWWLRSWWGHMLNVTHNNDPNLLLELHDYNPTNLTTPASRKQPMDSIAWGTAEDVAAVHDDFAFLSEYSRAHSNISLILGEFGVSNLQPNKTARLLWYRTVSEAAASAGVAPILWDGGGSWFQLFNRANGTWDQEVLAAVGLSIPPTPPPPN